MKEKVLIICLALWLVCTIAEYILTLYKHHLDKKQIALKQEMCEKAQKICNKECENCAWFDMRGEE